MKKLFIVFIALFILFSCNEGGSGIFFTIKNERPLENKELNDNLSIDQFVFSSENYYFSASNVYYLPINQVDQSTWKELINFQEPTANGVNRISSSVAYFQDNLYAVFIDEELSKPLVTRLMRLEGDIWKDVTTASKLNDKFIDSLFMLNNNLFASIKETDGSYSLYSADSSAVFNSTPLISNKNRIKDAVYGHGNYWFLSSGGLSYTNGPTTPASFMAVSSIDPKVAEAIACELSADDNILLSVKLKDSTYNVYFYDSTPAWHAITTAGVSVPLKDLKEIYIEGSPDSLLVIGSDNGYYELNHHAETPTFISPGSSNSLTAKANYISINLKNYVINGFYYKADEPRVLYGLTNFNGLWKNNLDPASATYKIWTIE